MTGPRLARAAIRSAAAIALLLAAAAASAADLVLPFGVPKHGRLELAIPEGWSVDTRPIEDPGGLAMRLTPVDGAQVHVLVTVMAPPKGPVSPEALRAGAEENARELRPGAVEREIAVEMRSGQAARLAFAERRGRRRGPPLDARERAGASFASARTVKTRSRSPLAAAPCVTWRHSPSGGSRSRQRRSVAETVGFAPKDGATLDRLLASVRLE